MSYEPRPDPSGDTLLRTRDQIRTNFEVIRDRFQDNHDLYSTGEGKHTLIDLVEQTTFPATAANESWIASREFNSSTELAWRPESTGAAGDQYILSAMPIRAACRFQLASTGESTPSTIGRAFNITSITRQSSNRYRIVMTTAAPSENYFLIGTSYLIGASSGSRGIIQLDYTSSSHADNTFDIIIPSEANNQNVQFVVYGG